MSATTTSTPEAGPSSVGELAHIAPGALILERNIRDAKPSKSLVESIKAVGLLEPITAVTSPSGLVIRFGHRRALAAVEAGLQTVPVYVVGADNLADDAEVLRVLSQFDENTERTGLSAADEAGVVEQLVAFGLTADQITQRARVDRSQVDHAIAIAQSSVAREAAAQWDALTLDQAAALAEFEDDPEVVEVLIDKAVNDPGVFAHVVQRKRDDREQAAARREALDKLTATGVTVVDEPSWNDKTKRLDSLLDSAGKSLTVKAHSTCAGHVAWLNVPGNPVYGCTNWKAHGHRERYPSGSLGTGKTAAADMSEAEREQAKKARKLVIENNKAWDSAQVVRREWLSELAKRKTAPKGAAAHIAAVLGVDSRVLTDYRVEDLASGWLGIKAGPYGTSPIADAAAKAPEGRALLIALIQILAAVESMRGRDDWRQNGKSSAAGRHLRYLESIGYELSDVEKYAVSSKTGA